MERQAGSIEGAAPIPFVELAAQAGAKIPSNTVAAGAVSALLGAPFELVKGVLSGQFAQKGSDILEKNSKAAELGYEAVKEMSFKWPLTGTGPNPGES